VIDGSLIISDCEGYEEHLFTDPVVKRLGHVTVLIETHESVKPGITGALRQAFEATHSVVEVDSTATRLAPPPLTGFTKQEERLAAEEFRSETLWLLITPTSACR
jgi:hypothetical protein